jgi:hypothetical protein
MDVINEEPFGDRLHAKKFEPSLEIEVHQKGITFYFEGGNKV